jgi:hypothetical protein
MKANGGASILPWSAAAQHADSFAAGNPLSLYLAAAAAGL